MPSRSKSPDLPKLVASWRNGSEGFFKFIADVQPRVKAHTGGFAPFQLDDRMRVEIAKALDHDNAVAVFCWPRRHGKTATSSMIVIWRFLTRVAENIAIVANSERQVNSTAFKILREAFAHTPFLKRLVAAGSITVLQDRIQFHATSSTIQAFAANPSALWGKALSCAQISELHAAPHGDEVFAALAGSLLDTAGSIMLIDSTVGPRSSKLYELHQAATRPDDPDTSIAFSHISYADLDEACEHAPPWLSQAKLRALSRQMLPHEFALYHLNRWGDASNLLFPADILAGCIEEYPLDPKALAAGATYIVGGGLDRAFGMSRHGDRTFCACVVKTVIDDDEHYYVLDASPIFLSRLGGIKSKFGEYHKSYGLKRLTIESYNSQDVADYAATQPYGPGVETVHVHRKLKHSAFTALYTAAAEKRLHIHPKFKDLIEEMKVFEVHVDGKATDGEAAIPKFKHPRGGRDDALHAVCWAAYSLRHETLNPYEIEGINCHGTGPNVAACALNGGAHIPLCADQCRSMREAMRLHEAHLARAPINPLPLPAFIIEKVVNTGAHSIPR